MLQLMMKCARDVCNVNFIRDNPKRKYCSPKCQRLGKNALVLHDKLIGTVGGLNAIGNGMILVRFGITHPTSHVVRWYPGQKSRFPRLGFPLPMINLPYDHLPGTGLYNLAFYGVDGRLALEPDVRMSINFPKGREPVPFTNGVEWKHKELPL